MQKSRNERVFLLLNKKPVITINSVITDLAGKNTAEPRTSVLARIKREWMRLQDMYGPRSWEPLLVLGGCDAAKRNFPPLSECS